MKWLALCLLSVCVLPPTVSAHVLDQYLQVAQIALAPDGVRVELRLMPGAQVTEQICTLIDADSDGRITTAEEQTYAHRVLADIQLGLNDTNLPLTLSDVQFPTQQDIRAGLGTIRLILTATTTLGAAAGQQLYFRNNHWPALGVYLVNALVPTTNEIKIGGQERDPLQREMRLNFHVISAPTGKSQSWTGVLMFGLCLVLLLPQWKRLRAFLRRYNIHQTGGD